MLEWINPCGALDSRRCGNDGIFLGCEFLAVKSCCSMGNNSAQPGSCGAFTHKIFPKILRGPKKPQDDKFFLICEWILCEWGPKKPHR